MKKDIFNNYDTYIESSMVKGIHIDRISLFDIFFVIEKSELFLHLNAMKRSIFVEYCGTKHPLGKDLLSCLGTQRAGLKKHHKSRKSQRDEYINQIPNTISSWNKEHRSVVVDGRFLSSRGSNIKCIETISSIGLLTFLRKKGILLEITDPLLFRDSLQTVLTEDILPVRKHYLVDESTLYLNSILLVENAFDEMFYWIESVAEYFTRYGYVISVNEISSDELLFDESIKYELYAYNQVKGTSLFAFTCCSTSDFLVRKKKVFVKSGTKKKNIHYVRGILHVAEVSDLL